VVNLQIVHDARRRGGIAVIWEEIAQSIRWLSSYNRGSSIYLSWHGIDEVTQLGGLACNGKRGVGRCDIAVSDKVGDQVIIDVDRGIT